MPRSLPLSLFALALLLLLPAAANADPLVVTGGTIQYSFARGAFRSGGGTVSGSGFSISFGNPDGPGQAGLSANCTSLPCAPGTVVNTGGSIIPNNLPPFIGSATIGGDTYSIINVNGLLTFIGADVTLPALSPGTLVLSTPFTMSGSISVSAFINGSFQGVFSSDLVGSGTAFLTFNGTQDGYVLQSYRYVFAADPSAVPEPATMILLATGLAGVAARARRRRKA